MGIDGGDAGSSAVERAVVGNPAMGMCSFDAEGIVDHAGEVGTVVKIVHRHRNVRVRFSRGLCCRGTKRRQRPLCCTAMRQIPALRRS